MTSLVYEWVQPADLGAVFALETASFPADEAASLDSLTYRQANAPSLFLAAFTPAPSRSLVAFTCATLTPSPTLTHDSMSTHVPDAPYVAIHSVCVAPDHRRKGIAVALLKEYLARVRAQPGRKGARLITHEELVPLYSKAGFELIGESSVVHGERKWWEMKVDFPEPPPPVVPEMRSPGLVWESFGGMDVLLDDQSRNAGDLFCPRGECRCLLLKAGVAKWVRGHESDFVLPELPRPLTSPAPTLPSSGYWSISSPLAFENIGFSRNASLPSASTTTIKYLICADCDHGPLGWHDTEGRDLGLEVELENEGKGGELRKGREFLLDVGRVRYRVG